MPIPKPNQNEDKTKFVARCMGNETMKKEYPDSKQRVAICLGQTRKSKSGIFDSVLEILGFSLGCVECDEDGELVDYNNLIVPKTEDYEDFGEASEDVEVENIVAKYEYVDPVTREIYYFERKGNYKKDGRYLRFEGEAKAAEYQGRKVTLNKPFRTPSGPKKFAVYTKNESGNVVIVRFGDPNMKIKKNIPERRKSFRARHNCDSPGPKWKARYWSCKAW
jgi:hypothetical protein